MAESDVHATIKRTLEKLCTALRYQTYNSWCASISCVTEIQKQLYNIHNTVKVGDLVVEMSSLGGVYPDILAVGYLKRIASEPMPVSGWDEAFEGSPPPEEEVFYIEAFNGQEIRWTNCKFLKVAAERMQHFKPST